MVIATQKIETLAQVSYWKSSYSVPENSYYHEF